MVPLLTVSSVETSGLCLTISKQIKAHAVQTCTNGVLPYHQIATEDSSKPLTNNTCPLTKSQGRLQLLILHETEQDAVKCLESLVTTAFAN